MPGGREDFKEIMHFHYMTYGRAIAQNLQPMSHEIFNFEKPFLGHYYYIISLSEPCPRVVKNQDI